MLSMMRSPVCETSHILPLVILTTIPGGGYYYYPYHTPVKRLGLRAIQCHI